MWRAHGYSGPWLVFWGSNAIGVYRPLIYRGENILLLPCGTMFPHGLTSARHVAAWRASDPAGSDRGASIVWTGVHAITRSNTCLN